jgi:hypothetical protein
MDTNARGAGINLFLALSVIALAGCLDSGDDTTLSAEPESPPGDNSLNNPPQISGSPAPQVLVGDNYSFSPSASDADGDSLSFSIQNKPDWTQFDSSTGRLSGMATTGTEGTYNDISISVSDGFTSVSLPRFSIEVTQAALGVVTLSWTAPVTNQDGTPLTDLRSYTIYYGSESGNYTDTIEVDNAGTTTYVVENLVPDTYYFAVTATNKSSAESSYSEELVHRIN